MDKNKDNKTAVERSKESFENLTAYIINKNMESSGTSDVPVFLNSERTPKADRVAAFNSGEIKIVDKTGFNSGDVIVEQDGEKFVLDTDGTVKEGVGEVFDIGMIDAAEGLESVKVRKLDKEGVGEVFDIGMREAAEGLEVGKLDDDDVNSPV